MPTAAKKAAPRKPGRMEETTELSEQVLDELKEGQRAAIEAVRGFMAAVDEVLPHQGTEPTRRQEIVDSALEMSQKLVKTQYDFLTHVVHDAGKALSRTNGGT